MITVNGRSTTEDEMTRVLWDAMMINDLVLMLEPTEEGGWQIVVTQTMLTEDANEADEIEEDGTMWVTHTMLALDLSPPAPDELLSLVAAFAEVSLRLQTAPIGVVLSA